MYQFTFPHIFGMENCIKMIFMSKWFLILLEYIDNIITFGPLTTSASFTRVGSHMGSWESCKNNRNQRNYLLRLATSYNQYLWVLTHFAWSYHKCFSTSLLGDRPGSSFVQINVMWSYLGIPARWCPSSVSRPPACQCHIYCLRHLDTHNN